MCLELPDCHSLSDLGFAGLCLDPGLGLRGLGHHRSGWVGTLILGVCGDHGRTKDDEG